MVDKESGCNCCSEKTCEKIKSNIVAQVSFEFLVAAISNLTTTLISQYGGVNQTTITGTQTIISAILLPKHANIIQTASLAAIMEPTTFQNFSFSLIVAIFVVVIYRVFSTFCLDIGGRAGTIAFFANLFTSLICYLIGLSGVYNFNGKEIYWKPSEYSGLNVYVFIFGPLLSALSNVGVYFVQYHYPDFIKIAARCGAYGLITIYGSQWLQVVKPVLYIRDNERKDQVTYAQIFTSLWHIGALGGVTLNTRFQNYAKGYYFQNYMISGYIAGWFYIGMYGMCIIGGKLGFLAFISNNIIIRILNGLNKCKKFEPKEERKFKIQSRPSNQILIDIGLQRILDAESDSPRKSKLEEKEVDSINLNHRNNHHEESHQDRGQHEQNMKNSHYAIEEQPKDLKAWESMADDNNNVPEYKSSCKSSSKHSHTHINRGLFGQTLSRESEKENEESKLEEKPSNKRPSFHESSVLSKRKKSQLELNNLSIRDNNIIPGVSNTTGLSNVTRQRSGEVKGIGNANLHNLLENGSMFNGNERNNRHNGSTADNPPQSNHYEQHQPNYNNYENNSSNQESYNNTIAQDNQSHNLLIGMNPCDPLESRATKETSDNNLNFGDVIETRYELNTESNEKLINENYTNNKL